MALGVKTGGRVGGTLNKATAEIKAAAQLYGAEIIKELARLALNAENERTRVAACSELLDRGFGKPSQAIEHSGTIAHVTELADAQLEAIATGVAMEALH